MKSKFLALSLLVASLGFANAADIEISDIYAKATPPGAKNTALFFNVKNNTDKPVKLIGASSPAAATGEIHTHKEVDGMKKMVQIDSIEVAPESTVSLKPGGLHVMLMDIKAPIKEGDKLDATLEFDNGQKLELKDIVAKPVVAKKDGEHGHDHGGHHKH
ncbi:MAG: copper chaperone PCu(A)C [Campylobacter sp.]